ncbi:hypothetical protein, partial [Rhodopirellula bahusiensis]|uniref:hypothetical protein n=1 Tax=Rhodopirellula bahusiensis TaxID=2014065 RepID=UPI0032636A08
MPFVDLGSGSAEWDRRSHLAFASTWAGPVSGRGGRGSSNHDTKMCILPDTELLMLLQHSSNIPGP